MALWTLGVDVVVDEIMCPFEGRSFEITHIPNKPHPDGIKLWGLANQSFLLLWNWHSPGEGKGPLDTGTPREFGGTAKAGNRGNKTQAVVVKLVGQLPESEYHVWLDNLFTSTPFLEYMRKLGFGVTGTTRLNGRLTPEILEYV